MLFIFREAAHGHPNEHCPLGQLLGDPVFPLNGVITGQCMSLYFLLVSTVRSDPFLYSSTLLMWSSLSSTLISFRASFWKLDSSPGMAHVPTTHSSCDGIQAAMVTAPAEGNGG